jgi:hypothetical protein
MITLEMGIREITLPTKVREGRLEVSGEGDDNRRGVSDQLRELVWLISSSISRLRFSILRKM